MDKLIDAVLEWWEEHEGDVGFNDNEGDEYNVYDSPPEFVKIAQKLKKE